MQRSVELGKQQSMGLPEEALNLLPFFGVTISDYSNLKERIIHMMIYLCFIFHTCIELVSYFDE